MALFSVTILQEWLGQQVINRFTYQSTGIPAAVSLSFGLFKTFSDADGTGTVVAAMRNLQSSENYYRSIEVRNLYSDTDFYATPYNAGVAGILTNSERAAPFLALKFTSSRTNLSVRRGTKSLSGLVEDMMNSGGGLASNYINDAVTAKNAFGATLTYTDEGETLSYLPVVLGREKYTTSAGTEAYKYYDTEAEQLLHLASASVWSYSDRITTQSSRKYGRGA